MTRKRFTPEEIIDKLREAEVLLSQGQSVQQAARTLEISEQPYRRWLGRLKVGPLFIEPGSPWENGYVESFNGKMRDELLAGEIFCSLKEAQVLVEDWRCHYNHFRSHSALGYRPPAPRAVLDPLTTQTLTLRLVQMIGGRS